MSKYVCGLPINPHTFCNMLWYFVATATPILLAALTQHHSNVWIFRFSLITFFSLNYYDYFAFQVALTEYLKLIEVLEHRFCRCCVCYFLFEVWACRPGPFSTLSKYESIKCQVPFRLLFNVNGIKHILKMLHKQLQQDVRAVVIYSATWRQNERMENSNGILIIIIYSLDTLACDGNVFRWHYSIRLCLCVTGIRPFQFFQKKDALEIRINTLLGFKK